MFAFCFIWLHAQELFQKHTLNQFICLPFFFQWFLGKAINSTFDADVLKSKAWASITWVEAPTAYLAKFWVLDGIALEIWSAKTHLLNGYQVVMAQRPLLKPEKNMAWI